MTERHLSTSATLRAWCVERAAGDLELTQAGRVAVPVRLRHVDEPIFSAEAKLVLTADDAAALSVALTLLLHPGGGQEAGS